VSNTHLREAQSANPEGKPKELFAQREAQSAKGKPEEKPKETLWLAGPKGHGSAKVQISFGSKGPKFIS
jgi:hypothetical protein